MNKIIIVLIVFCLLAIVGCDSVTLTKTPEQQLLFELENCDHKYSTSNYANTELNIQYCNKVLDIVNDLMEKGCMTNNITTIQYYQQQIYNATATTVKSIADNIQGDI